MAWHVMVPGMERVTSRVRGIHSRFYSHAIWRRASWDLKRWRKMTQIDSSVRVMETI